MSRKVYIYKITNKENNRVYVGSSLKPEARCASHFGMLEDGNHHSYKLQEDYNKFGADVFLFEILDETDEEQRDIVEHSYIVKYDGYTSGYNIVIPVNFNPSVCSLNLVKIEHLKIDFEKELFEKFSLLELVIHNYMYQMYTELSKIGVEYSESGDSIASKFYISTKSVQRTLKKLEDFVSTTWDKKKSCSNIYKVKPLTV